MHIVVQVLRERVKEKNLLTSIERETFFHHDEELAKSFEKDKTNIVPYHHKKGTVIEVGIIEKKFIPKEKVAKEIAAYLEKKGTVSAPKLSKVFGERTVKELLG